MGGSKDEDGSTVPYREFNVAFDPEALKIVLYVYYTVNFPCCQQLICQDSDLYKLYLKLYTEKSESENFISNEV